MNTIATFAIFLQIVSTVPTMVVVDVTNDESWMSIWKRVGYTTLLEAQVQEVAPNTAISLIAICANLATETGVPWTPLGVAMKGVDVMAVCRVAPENVDASVATRLCNVLNLKGTFWPKQQKIVCSQKADEF